jgi:hypothetical protein
MKHLAQNIKQLLASSNVRVSRLAQLTGVNQPTLYRIVNSDSQSPREGTVRPLAEFLGVSVAALCYQDLRVPIKQLVKDESALLALRDRNLNLLEPLSQVGAPGMAIGGPTGPLSTSSAFGGPTGPHNMAIGGQAIPHSAAMGGLSATQGLNLTGGALPSVNQARYSQGIGGLPHGLTVDPNSGGLAALLQRTPKSPEEQFRSRWRLMQHPIFLDMLGMCVPAEHLDNGVTVGPTNTMKRVDYLSDRLAVELKIIGPMPSGVLQTSPLLEIQQIAEFSYNNLASRIEKPLVQLALIKKTKPNLRALLIVMACKPPLDDDPGVQQAQWEAEQFGVDLAIVDSPLAATELICQLEGLPSPRVTTSEDDDES